MHSTAVLRLLVIEWVATARTRSVCLAFVALEFSMSAWCSARVICE